MVGRDTARDVTATAFALARSLGKIAGHPGVCHGLSGDRILSQYHSAADNLIPDGADLYRIQAAPRAFGYPISPSGVSNLVSLDFPPTDDHFWTPAPPLANLVEAGATFDSLNRKDNS